MNIEVRKEFLEEIVKDIAELCDSSFHVCPHEQWQSKGEPECREDGSPYLKGDDDIQCTCEEFDTVRDKITHLIEESEGKREKSSLGWFKTREGEKTEYRNGEPPAEEVLTEKQILGEIDNLERELEGYELYAPADLDAICSLENKLNTFNVKLKTMVFDYLKKTYPKSNYADEDLTKNANYNDVFFEMVDDVRNKFLNEKQYDSANEMVEEYMDKNNF